MRHWLIVRTDEIMRRSKLVCRFSGVLKRLLDWVWKLETISESFRFCCQIDCLQNCLYFLLSRLNTNPWWNDVHDLTKDKNMNHFLLFYSQLWLFLWVFWSFRIEKHESILNFSKGKSRNYPFYLKTKFQFTMFQQFWICSVRGILKFLNILKTFENN